MSKGELMAMTGNERGVDAALPQGWLDEMAKTFSYDNVRMWYAISYKNNSGGKPIHLGEELIRLMQTRQVNVQFEDDDNIYPTYLIDMIKSILQNPERVVKVVLEG